MCDFGTISQSDVDRLFFTDDVNNDKSTCCLLVLHPERIDSFICRLQVDEAFDHISQALVAKEVEAGAVAPLSPFNAARAGIGKKVPDLKI